MPPAAHVKAKKSGSPATASSSSSERLVWMDPARLRFQHSRIRPFFSGCGRSLDETLQSILDGRLHPSDLPPIQVILGKSDDNNHDDDEPCYVSLNNRRLWILKQCRQQGLLKDNVIAVRVRSPKSAAEANRYSAANCALEATVMREVAAKTTLLLRVKKDTPKEVPLEGETTASDIDEEVDAGFSCDESSAEDSSDNESPRHTSNRFGTLDSSSSCSEDDTDSSDHDDDLAEVADQLAQLALAPSSVLSEEATTRYLSAARRPDNEREANALDDPVFDLEHKMCYKMDFDHLYVIENSTNVYISVQLHCGVTVSYAPDVRAHCPAVLADLESDLADCLGFLPKSVHRLIKRTRVWVNSSYQYGSKKDPMVVNHTTAHHHPGWLAWAHDRLDKTFGIEIYNCNDYRRMRLHWNGCGLMLHELCHIIHQFALTGGLENHQVNKVYETARASGLYENVRRRDWAGKNEDYDLAYAMVDSKEFFSEMSVAFWSKGYKELDKEDNCRVLCCSPPFMETSVIERIQSHMPEQAKELSKKCQTDQRYPLESLFRGLFMYPKPQQVMCNKFYPFTCGQLKHYDPATFYEMSQLWCEIANWHDPVVGDVSNHVFWCWNAPPGRKEPSPTYSDTVNM